MQDKDCLERLKNEIRQQTKEMGKSYMTCETALLVLLKNHEKCLERLLLEFGYNPEKIYSKIMQHCKTEQCDTKEILIDRRLQEIFKKCKKHNNVESFAGILLAEGDVPFYYLGLDCKEPEFRDCLKNRFDTGGMAQEECEIKHTANFPHCTDLTALPIIGEEPFFGREQELERMIGILMCRKKNNVLLLGEAGVGKTALVEALATKIAKGDIPAELAECRVLSLNLASLIGGASGRGEFEERVENLFQSFEKSHIPIILFIDEFHSVIGLGNEGNFDFANLLKPILARKGLSCIGATTFREYKIYVEKDSALVRRFQNVQVLEPSVVETYEILKHVKKDYEMFHHIQYEDEALKACAELTDQYIVNRRLPDKALDILDEIGVAAKRARAEAVNQEMVTNFLAKKLNIHISGQINGEINQVKELRGLLEKVPGYEKEREKLCKTLLISQYKLEDAEAGNCIISFYGTSDLGEISYIKAIRKVYFPKTEAYLELDLSEYQEKHMISKLIGSPPGYVGSQESGMLTDKLKNFPRMLLVLKNVNSAHEQIIKFLKKILQGSQITDVYGSQVKLQGSIVILDNCSDGGVTDENELDQLACDKIYFSTLTREALAVCGNTYLKWVQQRLKKQNICLKYETSVQEWVWHICAQFQTQSQLQNHIRTVVVGSLSNLILKEDYSERNVHIYWNGNMLKFKFQEEK